MKSSIKTQPGNACETAVRRGKSKSLASCICALGLLAGVFTTAAVAGEKSLEEQVNGLWYYTGLTTKDGTEMPLTGVFLFKDGVFLQQAVFNTEPFEDAGSMSHTGPTRAEPATGSIHLVATQQIGTARGQEEALSFKANTEHDVTVTREGDKLTLIFGMGTSTVQTFDYVGPGEGNLYALENGALALVDGHFVLVEGDENSAATGYGTYTQDGENLELHVIRWSEADASGAKNLKDVSLKASFDGKALTLADGRSFNVVN
ncbi:MAG TPA: hypothetical protein VFG52_03145 [Xanthomonadales bacterium]|nr:hypothetical protein [Xanthomonadales bacterium]